MTLFARPWETSQAHPPCSRRATPSFLMPRQKDGMLLQPIWLNTQMPCRQ